MSPRTVKVAGSPFAAVGLPGGRHVVASVTVDGRGELAVIAVGAGGSRVLRTVDLPLSMNGAAGVVLTGDGRLLLVAGQSETAVVSVPGLSRGTGDPVLGLLRDSGSGQTEVAVSPDDRFAFVTDETSGGLSVFDLAVARRDGFGARGVAVGIVPLAAGPVGVAVAPDGTRVYVTTLGGYGARGRLWAVDARRAEHGNEESAVLGEAAAGCQPVRVAVTPDGTTAWVTATQSNALLGFTTIAVQRDPGRALRAVVPVGSEPVGLLLLDRGRTALVADSDRGLVPGTGGDGGERISVVSTAKALAGRPALTGSLPAGRFPRDVGYDRATGQVMVANYLSGTLELLHFPASPLGDR